MGDGAFAGSISSREAGTHMRTRRLSLFENVTLQNSRDAASNTWASSASRARVFVDDRGRKLSMCVHGFDARNENLYHL